MPPQGKNNGHGPNRRTPTRGWRPLALLSLASLGVVYGDIGTSPLYAMRECFLGKYGIEPSQANVLGVLSLITWSLVLVISVKYLAFVLRADNDGEGGILALMELVRSPARGPARKLVLIVGLFGAALLYGDGMITPAISVLSAIEGLQVATPVFNAYILPITIAVLVGLFLIQRLGTGGIGRLFGPVMTIWFAVLALSGGAALLQNPSVLQAVNPWHGLAFFRDHSIGGLTTMGFVFLVVTGGEALYADIGHFGKTAIRVGWYAIVLPSLLLNYFGQGALILSHPGQIENPFYQLVPQWALYPMVGLATCATVIASQAIISGAFSLTFQAFQLGYLPRLRIVHTSSRQPGQIYIPAVNWLLLLAAIGLVLGFRHSGNLASAYGVAITTTMAITSLLFFLAMRWVLKWPMPVSIGLTTVFLAVDLAFFAANIGKFVEGGWFPLLVAGLAFTLMSTWRKGYALVHRNSRNRIQGVREYLASIGGGGKYRRVPGQAVYLANNPRGTPHSLRQNLEHNGALHHTVIIYTASFVKAPRVKASDHLKVSRLRSDITRVVAYYGFMESPNVPGDLHQADREYRLGIDLDHVTYFLEDEIPLARKEIGMSGWRSWLYTVMARNEVRATRYFDLPSDQVFEIGTEIQV